MKVGIATKALQSIIFTLIGFGVVVPSYVHGEEIKLTSYEAEISEAVIRHHFSGQGISGKLMARIEIKGKDPQTDFLSRFSDYNGFFGKISDVDLAEAQDNYYYLSIFKISLKNRNTAVVIANDNRSMYQFDLARQPDGKFTITNAFEIVDT